jgi:menaquinone-dependent protoporphyrinogen oxidase
MKTAIIFDSRHGTTTKVAGMIRERFPDRDVQQFQLNKNQSIELSEFDTIVIGGSIHAGSLNKHVKTFMKTHTATLLQKRIALFMCGTNEKELNIEFEREFPELLRNHSISNQIVGGELLYEKMNFLEAWMVKKITGIKISTSTIKQEAIEQLVTDIRK